MSVIDLLIIILIIVCLIVFWNKYGSTNAGIKNTPKSEGMAPLGWGSFPNNYPRGECETGSFKSGPCEIGNCPLETTVSHERYCGIVHSQDSDPVSRHENIARCIDEMKDGYCD